MEMDHWYISERRSPTTPLHIWYQPALGLRASREEPLLNNNNVSSLISFLCQDFHRSRQSRKPASRGCYCTTGEGTRSAESREGPSSSQGFRSAPLRNGRWLFEVLLRKRG
ncbi:unnamed protein product [Boreogadus saida]